MALVCWQHISHSLKGRRELALQTKVRVHIVLGASFHHLYPQPAAAFYSLCVMTVF